MIFSIECPELHFATANFWADIVNLQLTPSVNVILHLKFFNPVITGSGRLSRISLATEG